jgi:hypothetical protein
LLELVFCVGLVRENFTRGGVHEQERPAKRFPPKCARVLIAERPSFSDVASNFVNLRAALLDGRDTSGEKCDSQEKVRKNPALHSFPRTALRPGFVSWTSADFSSKPNDGLVKLSFAREGASNEENMDFRYRSNGGICFDSIG